MGFGDIEGVTHDYQRHGTTTLFAALNVLDGAVIAQCKPRHRHPEFLAFLRHTEANVPAQLDVHLVVDNYATHKHPKVRAWLARRPRWHIHFTPTYASWLNQVERFFALITQRAIRRGSFDSTADLVKKIGHFIRTHNPNSCPFVWTATAATFAHFNSYAAQGIETLGAPRPQGPDYIAPATQAVLPLEPDPQSTFSPSTAPAGTTASSSIMSKGATSTSIGRSRFAELATIRLTKMPGLIPSRLRQRRRRVTRSGTSSSSAALDPAPHVLKRTKTTGRQEILCRSRAKSVVWKVGQSLPVYSDKRTISQASRRPIEIILLHTSI
jgi:putative transposase